MPNWRGIPIDIFNFKDLSVRVMCVCVCVCACDGEKVGHEASGADETRGFEIESKSKE